MSKELKAVVTSAGTVMAIFVIAMFPKVHLIVGAAIVSAFVGVGFGVWVVLHDYQVEQQEDGRGDHSAGVKLGMFIMLWVVLLGVGCFVGDFNNNGFMRKALSVVLNWVFFTIGAALSIEKDQEIIELFHFKVLSH